MSRCAVSDHAVCGINGLITGTTRQTEKAEPERGRDDAIREIFRQTLDSRSANCRFIKLIRVPTDDHGNRLAPTLKPFGFQSRRNRRNMLLKAFLCRKRRTNDSNEKQAYWQKQKGTLNKDGQQNRHTEKNRQRQHTFHFPLCKRLIFPVPFSIQQRDKRTDPRDRMADKAEQPVRIADETFDQERQESESEEHERDFTG